VGKGLSVEESAKRILMPEEFVRILDILSYFRNTYLPPTCPPVM